MAHSSSPTVHLAARRGRLTPRARHHGNLMIEALVGLALGAILGLGMAWGAAQALKTQRFAATQNMAVFALRNDLANQAGLTPATPSFTLGTGLVVTATKTCPGTTNLQIATHNRPTSVIVQLPCTLKTDANAANKSILGGDGGIEFSPHL